MVLFQVFCPDVFKVVGYRFVVCGKGLKVLNSRWRSQFWNVETSANIAYSENRVISNKYFKTVLAVNVEKLSIESHENAQHLADWVCLPSKNEE